MLPVVSGVFLEREHFFHLPECYHSTAVRTSAVILGYRSCVHVFRVLDGIFFPLLYGYPIRIKQK